MQNEPQAHTSQILTALADQLCGERTSIRQIEEALQDRAFGLLILIFALPNLLPIGLPGMTAILGAPLILLTGQMVLGHKQPWLPDWIARRSFPTKDFIRFTGKGASWLRRIERGLKPRFARLTTPPAERFLLGVTGLLLSVAIALPIPLGNWLPALALVLMALGLLEKDGLFVAFGLTLGALGLAVVAAVILGGAELLGSFADWLL